MKAYALVQGPRRKVLYVSDSCHMLWCMGAETFQPSTSVSFSRHNRQICKDNGAYIVRIDFTLGDPITTPKRKRGAASTTQIKGNNSPEAVGGKE